MTETADFKEEVASTDSSEWTVFRDPPVWVNQKEELTIRVVKPFEQDALPQVTNRDLGEVFGNVDRGLGRIRIERRGVPYYDADFIVVGIRDERRFFPQSVTAENVNLSEFQKHVGRVMTEALGYYDYDDVLNTVE